MTHGLPIGRPTEPGCGTKLGNGSSPTTATSRRRPSLGWKQQDPTIEFDHIWIWMNLNYIEWYTYIHTHTRTPTHTRIPTYADTQLRRYAHTYKHYSNIQAFKHTAIHRQLDRQTETDRPTDRPTDRQTHRHTTVDAYTSSSAHGGGGSFRIGHL